MINMNVNDFIIIPVSGAVIGYITNWLAIKMLFRPLEEKRFFGVRVPFTPGIIPKERHVLAAKVGEAVGDYLITEEVLTNAVVSQAMLLQIEKSIDGLFERLQNSDKTINEALYALFPHNREKIITGAERVLFWAAQHMSDVAKSKLPSLGSALEAAFEGGKPLASGLKALICKVIDDNVGTVASLFVNKNKVYESIQTGLLAYINDETHQAEIGRQFDLWVDEFFETKIKDYETTLDTWLEQNTGAAFARIAPEALQNIKVLLLGAAAFALQKGAVSLAKSIQINEIVENQINALDIMEGERIILSVVRKELNAITLLGGVLGFCIGVITVLVGMPH